MSNIRNVTRTFGAISSWVENEETFTVQRNSAGLPTSIQSQHGKWIEEVCTFSYDQANKLIGMSGNIESELFYSLVEEAGGTSSASNSKTILVTASRNLLPSDDGNILKCTTSVTLTAVADTLPTHFGCAIIPNGTASIASSGGTNLNGATATLSRAAASNQLIMIVYNGSANDYLVTGS